MSLTPIFVSDPANLPWRASLATLKFFMTREPISRFIGYAYALMTQAP